MHNQRDNALICRRCGSMNRIDWQFCARCGAPLTRSSQSHQSPTSTTNQYPLRWAIPLLSGLFIIIVLTGAWMMWRALHPSPGQVSANPAAPAYTRATPSSSEPIDPVELKAREALRNAERQFGIQPPPTDHRGQVHLRGGGSISADQYNGVRQRLNQLGY